MAKSLSGYSLTGTSRSLTLTLTLTLTSQDALLEHLEEDSERNNALSRVFSSMLIWTGNATRFSLLLHRWRLSLLEEKGRILPVFIRNHAISQLASFLYDWRYHERHHQWGTKPNANANPYPNPNPNGRSESIIGAMLKWKTMVDVGRITRL